MHEQVRLNKNILIAFAASITVSAFIAQYLSDQEAYLNTTYTTIADYAIYFAVFGGMFYIDNRTKYRIPGEGTDTVALRRDLKRLVTSLGAAEVVYTAVRWALHYHLLTAGHDPYAASIASQCVATVAYMIAINLSVRLTNLYRGGGRDD